MKKLILIDGNSLLFRAYFAMRPMVTSKGLHTQGIFAFINMLNKIIKDYEPDYMAVAFDMKEKTFRHERYEAYKAGRQQTPIELLSEIPWMHKVLEAMNIAVLEKPGFEADDIIGTLASKGSEKGLRTLVISGICEPLIFFTELDIIRFIGDVFACITPYIINRYGFQGIIALEPIAVKGNNFIIKVGIVGIHGRNRIFDNILLN